MRVVMLCVLVRMSYCAQFGGRRGCCVKADSYLSTLSASPREDSSLMLTRPVPPSKENEWHRDWVERLDASLERLTGRKLLGSLGECELLAENSRLVCVSHDTTETGPIFNYATRAALNLWEMDWNEFVSLPSKQSAEEDAREERAILLETVARQGYVDNYSGIRISKSGKRFRISNVVIWNVDNAHGTLIGQAALFDIDDVKFL